jgi:hypothetical protein
VAAQLAAPADSATIRLTRMPNAAAAPAPARRGIEMRIGLLNCFYWNFSKHAKPIRSPLARKM